MYQKTAEKTASRQAGRRTPNRTGIPEPLKQRFEASSGMSFDDVRIHYNSGKPAEIGAYAFAQGNQVYLSPGQERHLSHELGHVIQQKAGMVRPTAWRRGLPVNTDPGLERMADDPFHTLGGAARQAPPEAAACIQGQWRRMNFMRRNCFLNKVEAKILPPELLSLLNLTQDSPPVTLLNLQVETEKPEEPAWEVYANGVRLPEQFLEELLKKNWRLRKEFFVPDPQYYFAFSQSSSYSVVGANLDAQMDYLRDLNETAAMQDPQKKRVKRSPSGEPLDYWGEYLKLRNTFIREDEILRREIERTWNNILHIEDSLTAMEFPSWEALQETIPARTEELVMYETRRYITKHYQDACDAVLLLRFYGRTSRQPYRDALELREIWLNKLKHTRAPLPEVREQVHDKLKQKFDEWGQMLVSSFGGGSAEEQAPESHVKQARRRLREKSLLVLPDSLPLAGVFPDCDAVRFSRDDREPTFPQLRRQADSLIKKYGLSGDDDGALDKTVRCVCVMYLKEKTGSETIYRPAFGASGFFKRKRNKLSIGMNAMGIPGTLLERDHAAKPAALFGFICMCNILGLRKPSMQAMLSYLQSDEEFRDVEDWTPVDCAEPAIVMAIRNLWHVTSELVISFPFQGHLHLQPGDIDKTPVPKYTCARCALAEYAFGAAVFNTEKQTREKEKGETRVTEKYVDREKMAMKMRANLRPGERAQMLSSDAYILNRDDEPFISIQPPYRKPSITTFLGWTEELGIYHMRAEDLLTKLESEISELEKLLNVEAAPPTAVVPDREVSSQAAVVIQIEFLNKIWRQLISQPDIPQASKNLAERLKALISSLALEMLHPGITQPVTIPDEALARLSSLVSDMTAPPGLPAPARAAT